MTDRHHSLGAAMAFVAGAVNVALMYFLFLLNYKPLIAVELAAGRPDEGFIVTYVIPALADLVIIGGVLWLLAGIGFVRRAGWAWNTAVFASVLTLAASFFPGIPMASRGMPPTYFAVFVPNLILFFVLFTQVNRLDRRVLWLSFFSGIATVLTFMNGVASMSKIMTTGLSLYVPAQQLCWAAALGWGIFTIGLILRQAWVHPVGMGAALLAALAGAPLAVISTIESARPSMFTPGPLLSVILLVILLTPWFRKTLKDWAG